MSFTRRQALKTLAAAPAALLGANRKAGDRPNLLFLWTDQQRFDTMAAYGNHSYKVPAQNALAAQSIVFDRCYVTQPVCSPNRAALMTGLYPHTSGIVTNNIALAADIPTLPEIVRGPYRTAYMGKWHLGDEIFAHHGFEKRVSIEDQYTQHFSDGRDRGARSDYHHFLVKLGYKPADDNKFSRGFSARLPIEHCKPAFLASEASEYILENRAEPWMLYVNFLEPHTPFFGPLDDLHSAEEAPLPANYPGIPEKDEPESYRKKREDFRKDGISGLDLSSREGWQRMARNYAGLCTQVDRAVAKILWSLEVSGQADNTIIVFTTDHGEMLGSHSLATKGVAYEESVRIPLLMRIPFAHGSQIHHAAPVSHVDVVPTLLDALGIKGPENLQGQSLLGAIRGEAPRRPDVFVQWNEGNSNRADARTVITPEGWKLVLHNKDRSMLFDLNRDPLEMRNLFYDSVGKDVVLGLRAKIERWQKETGDEMDLG